MPELTRSARRWLDPAYRDYCRNTAREKYREDPGFRKAALDRQRSFRKRRQDEAKRWEAVLKP